MQSEHGLERRRSALQRSLPIRADRSWIPAGALLAAHLAFAAFGERDLTTSVLLALITVVIIFATTVVHEWAHLLAEKLTGAEPTPSSIYVFGDAAHGPRSAAVAIAGPVASAVLGALLLLAPGALGTGFDDVLQVSGWASLGIAAFNLLPGLPLDGGHILASLTHRRRLAVRMGQLIGLVAVGGGIYLLTSGPEAADDTAFGLWLLLAGVFVLVQGRADARHVPRAALDGETAGDWARPFVGRVRATDTVPTGPGPFAVSDGSRLAGVISTGSTADTAAVCADVMVAWSPSLGVRADTPVRVAIERLLATNVDLLAVVDAKGIVRGVLDREAVRARVGTTI